MPAMRNTQTKYWCFTSYETEEPPYLDCMTYLIAGRETCPETGNKHWQCYVELKTKQRLSFFKNNDYYKHVHLEPRKGTALEASDYCKKEDTNPIIHGNISNAKPGERNDLNDAIAALQGGKTLNELMFDPDHMQAVARHMQYFRSAWNMILSTKTMRELRELYSTAVFRPWQEELISYLNAPVHPRQVLWYVDETGNQGKSWMASYLSTIGAFIVTNGKIADIAHAYNNETTVIFDLSRTQVDKIDHIYALMESFKNGRIFSPKYESVVKTFSPCHVVAFANFIPDHSKLSQDRWLVKTL